jgi:hypothetical protein
LNGAYQLGKCYYYGYGTGINIRKAYEIWRLCADGGHSLAALRYGQAVALGNDGMTYDEKDADKYITQAINDDRYIRRPLPCQQCSCDIPSLRVWQKLKIRPVNGTGHSLAAASVPAALMFSLSSSETKISSSVSALFSAPTSMPEAPSWLQRIGYVNDISQPFVVCDDLTPYEIVNSIISVIDVPLTSILLAPSVYSPPISSSIWIIKHRYTLLWDYILSHADKEPLHESVVIHFTQQIIASLSTTIKNIPTTLLESLRESHFVLLPPDGVDMVWHQWLLFLFLVTSFCSSFFDRTVYPLLLCMCMCVIESSIDYP